MIAINPSAVFAIASNPLNEWKRVIVHHTPLPKDYIITIEEPRIKNMMFRELRTYHQHHRGFSDIGYHLIIEGGGGLIASYRWMKQREGAHCLGYNEDSIGVAVVGNFSITGVVPSDYQIETLSQLIDEIGLPVFPHSYFKNTECPGNNFPDRFFTKENT